MPRLDERLMASMPASRKHMSVVCASLLLAGGSVIAPSIDVTSKYLSSVYPILCVVWVRYCGHAILALAFSLLSGVGIAQLRPSPVHLTRGLVQFISTVLFVLALTRLSINTALVIVFLAPLLVVMFRWAMQSEGADTIAVGIAVAGAMGAVVAYLPSIEQVDLVGLACALGAAVSLAMYFVLTGHVAQDSKPLVSSLYTALPASLLGLPFLSLTPFHPRAGDAPMFVWLGLGSVISHWLICLAMRSEFSSTISPIAYVEIPAGAVYAFTLFRQAPTWSEIVGGGIVLASGTALSVRLARRGGAVLVASESPLVTSQAAKPK